MPYLLARQLGGGFYTTLFLAPFTGFVILITFWTVASTISPRRNEKAKLAGRPVQDYLHFRNEQDRIKYYGKSRIPMETFHEMYFDEKVDFKGDCLEAMEYRHDWASFRFTLSLFKHFFTGMIPELIMHTRSQGTLTQSILLAIPVLTCPQTRNRFAITMIVATIFTAGSLVLA